MTSLQIENICLRASLEINAAIDADKDRRYVSSKAHLTGYLLSHFLMTMTSLGDAVRFDLLVDPMKDQLIEG
jgi:hypothetical protein